MSDSAFSQLSGLSNIAINSSNGFAGSVLISSALATITLSTSITGLLKGNGTAISAAVANTDYQSPITLTTTGTSGAATLISNTLNIPQYSGGTGTVTSVSVTSANGFAGTVATSTTTPAITVSTTITGIVKGNGTAISAASAGTDYTTPTGTEGLSNKRITKRFVTVTQSATPAINSDTTDIASITGLAQAVTSFTTSLTGTPVAGDYLMVQITDNGTARALTWGAKFTATTVALPTTTVISTLLRVGFQWNATTSVWNCIAVA